MFDMALNTPVLNKCDDFEFCKLIILVKRNFPKLVKRKLKTENLL